jgi:uncharacterized protein YjlB
MTEIVHQMLKDDGDIPNNAKLPLILYKGALQTTTNDPDAEFQDLFHANGWGNGWRDQVIFSFHHYHAQAHEVVGVARGKATIQFGGPTGPAIDVEAGDVALIPAGVGHCRLDDAPGLSVVGAYPPGQNADVKRQGETELEAIRATVQAVPLPITDPVLGNEGPALALWVS